MMASRRSRVDPERRNTERHVPPPADDHSGDSGRPDGDQKEVDGSWSKDLSRDDFVFLLSILEGELQARDEAITILRADKMGLATLEAQYGSEGPERALRALQRDSIQAQACEGQAHQARLHHVYKKPMAELDRLVETQRRSSRRMMGQLVEVERAHSGALCRLEEQESNHRSFILRSDDLTALLEQDRERLQLLVAKEKAYREEKEEESEREVSALKEELIKLKAFALLVVDEQQRLSEQLDEQSSRVQELTAISDQARPLPTAISDQARQELHSTHSKAKEGQLRVLSLEAELRDQASVFHQTQEAMTAKLANEDAQNHQLRQRLVALSRQLDELEGTRGALRRAEEELQELRDRVRYREEVVERGAGTSSLLSDVEVLRRRVVQMEGKDEELIHMGDQCRDLDRRLGRETSQSRSLRAEVDKLNTRISELDRLEEALGKSRQECGTLKGNLERERSTAKQLSAEMDILKVRVRELEAVEGQLEKTEVALRQDLAKLRTLTMALVEDRKSMAETLRQAEETRLNRNEGKQNEQHSLTTVTETLRQERQQASRCKAELEDMFKSTARERDELQARLKTEEESSGHLRSNVGAMKKRLQVLESWKEKEDKKERERRQVDNSPSNCNHHFHEEDNNKVRELSQEVEKLRRRLLEKEVVEGELMKAEEGFESLGSRFRKEQQTSHALTDELDKAKRELSRYQLVEKQEVNQEHLLLRRLQQEQVKSRLLSREVEALKAKLQKLTGTDECISQVQTDHSTLQKKLNQQEARNRELAREMEGLTGELERYRQISKNLRPGVNGRRYSELHQSSKEVQTELADGLYPEYSGLAPLSLNGKLLEYDSDQEDLNQNEDQARRSLSPLNNLNSLNHVNNNMRRYNSHSANGVDTQHQPASDEMTNGHVKKGDVVLTHTPGQPLHIKVTPDHSLNTATLEISSPTADNTASYTSTAVIPTSGAPPKQRITIIQNSALSAVKTKSSPPSSPDRDLSPLPISRVVSPASIRSVTPPDHNNSPLQIVTVSAGSPEPTEVVGQAVFRMTPERQNGWHVQRSNSTGGSSPSVITTEDNKIHIHLGSPYIQSIHGIAHSIPQPGGPYYSLRQEQRTQVLTNGCHVKGSGKITSSITITPTTSPVSHPSNMTVSGLYD